MKYILTVLFSLIVSPLFAQFIEPNSSSSGGTFPPTGCVTANGVIFNNVTPCNSNFIYDGIGNVVLGSSIALNWNSDTFLTRSAAAKLQFGAADINGSPVAQTLKFQSALAGSATNTASANSTIIGSLGTGTGTNGDTILQVGVKTTTGTAQATPTTALTVKGETLATVFAGQIQPIAGGAGNVSINFGANTGYTGASGSSLSTYVNNALVGFWGASNLTINGGSLSLSVLAQVNWAGNAFLTSTGTGTFRFGANDAPVPVAQVLGMQNVAAGTANTAGADFTLNASKSTGTGVGGKTILTTTITGTTGSAVNNNFPMLSLNPGSATTSTVQFGDGTNITTYDSCTTLTTSATGVIACTASAIRFKDIYDPRPLNLAGLDALRTDIPWKYRNDVGYGLDTTKIHVGLFADDVEKLDPRCVVYRTDGLGDYEDRCVIAYLVADRKNLHAEIDALRKKIDER